MLGGVVAIALVLNNDQSTDDASAAAKVDVKCPNNKKEVFVKDYEVKPYEYKKVNEFKAGSTYIFKGKRGAYKYWDNKTWSYGFYLVNNATTGPNFSFKDNNGTSKTKADAEKEFKTRKELYTVPSNFSSKKHRAYLKLNYAVSSSGLLNDASNAIVISLYRCQ